MQYSSGPLRLNLLYFSFIISKLRITAQSWPVELPDRPRLAREHMLACKPLGLASLLCLCGQEYVYSVNSILSTDEDTCRG